MFTKGKTKIITYISDPHSKSSKSQTKLKRAKNSFDAVLFDASFSKTCN